MTPDATSGVPQPSDAALPAAAPTRRRWSLAGLVGLAIVVGMLSLAVVGPWIAPYSAGKVASPDEFASMSLKHPLGTDYLGRDMLSRVLFGARYTIGLALAATVIACLAGTLLGLLAAATGGWLDFGLSRCLDALISIPSLLFGLVVVAAFGSSIPILIATAAIIYTPGAYRIGRSLAVNVAAQDFVTVARARGEATGYIMLSEILPNIVGPVLTDFGLRFVFVILLLSRLSFLGLGIQPPHADWGSLVRENISGLVYGAPAVVAPAIAIALLTISVNLVIDNLLGSSQRDWRAIDVGNAVTVERLHVVGRSDAGREEAIVSDVSLAIPTGEVLALIGESGSGKSTIALALMGYARPGCRITSGRIDIGGTDVLALAGRARAALRGRRVAYVAQSAAAAFNPARRLMAQVIEPAAIHGTASADAARTRAIALFAALSLPEPERIGDRFPHQVSGGQLQRLMLAMALINEPDVVILDEPTTALDVTTQIDVLTAFRKVVRERRTTALYVSHDLAVVAQVADQIVVLQRGAIQETGRTPALLARPAHAYTRSLIEAADPAARMSPSVSGTAPRPSPLLRLRGVSAGYGPLGKGSSPSTTVLHDIDLEIREGSAVGVIGESGSGKSTLACVIAGLLPAARGTIELDGRVLAPRGADRSRAELREIQIVFQMADTALNPAHTVGRILARPLTLFDGLTGAVLRQRVDELLDMVQLSAAYAARRPHELSGGQKQRINLARALAANPKLILCDEVTSSLDTVVGAAILKLLAELRQRLALSYLFISHDLSTVRAVCDEVVVLYAGRRMQSTPGGAMRSAPVHPYVDLLIGSIPELRVGWLDELAARRIVDLPGAAPAARGPSCAFQARCGLAIAGTCDTSSPPERTLTSGAIIACHRSEADLIAAQSATPMPTRPHHRRSS